MIIIKQGVDIFSMSDRALIVNPVNTVGVMGAGLAKQFAIRYPDMVGPYKEACKTGDLDIGKPWRWNDVICVATKQHWRDPSQYAFVEASLKHLCHYTTPIALPPLGAGLGGLDRDIVIDMITWWLDPSPIEHYLMI